MVIQLTKTGKKLQKAIEIIQNIGSDENLKLDKSCNCFSNYLDCKINFNKIDN